MKKYINNVKLGVPCIPKEIRKVLKKTKVMVTEGGELIVLPGKKDWRGNIANFKGKEASNRIKPGKMVNGKWTVDPRCTKAHELDAIVESQMTTRKIRVLSKAYHVELGEECDLPGCAGMTWAQAIARGLVKAGAGGDVAAAKELREVTEGKLPEIVKWEDATPSREVEEIDNRIRELLTKAESRGEDRTSKPAGKEVKAPSHKQD